MHVRLTRAGRFVVVLAIAVASAFAGAAGANARKPHAATWRCVLVRPGDTLWGLARGIAPRSDPRKVIAAIQRRNGVGGGVLMPGDALWVPWEGAGPPAGARECGYVG